MLVFLNSSVLYTSDPLWDVAGCESEGIVAAVATAPHGLLLI